MAHPQVVGDWHAASNTLVVLATTDELALQWLYADAVKGGLRAVGFHEPDLGGALTAVALEPAARRLVSHLPLALSRGEEVKMSTPTTDVVDLRARLVELAAERDALRAQLEGDLPAATRWLQRKVWRQAAALDLLNRRVVTQRFVLRILGELGRSLTVEEYRAAKARITDRHMRDRIDDPDAA